MNSYTRKNFGHDEEIIKVSDDPEDTSYCVGSYEEN